MRGCIQKRRLKGKNSYQYYVVYDIGMRWDEKKHREVREQKWEKVPPPNTRKHAETLLAQRLAQLHSDEYVRPTKTTLRSFTDHWMQIYASTQVRPATMNLYEGLLTRHINPALGHTQLSKLSTEDIERLKHAKTQAGLSPQTIKHILRLIRQILSHAVEWNYLKRNPAKTVKYPRVPIKEADFLTSEEIRIFLSCVSPDWYAFFTTAITTGLRMGELLAMKWQNLDWDKSRYFVRETYNRKRGKYAACFAEPKTAGAKQSVDLTPTCVAALKQHHETQHQIKLQHEKDYKQLDLIFATKFGSPLDHKNIVHRQFHLFLEEANLRRIRFHDLRHTCASLLIDIGASAKYIQRQLRHTSVETTFNRYGHLFPDANREVTDKLEKELFQTNN